MQGSSAALMAVLAIALAAGTGGAVQWVDVASPSGVAFRNAGEVHVDSTQDPDQDWPAFPEILGSGACWADWDNDGYDDLYLVSQQYNPHNPGVGPWARALDPHNVLFRNNGDGTFTDVSEGSGADLRVFGYGCSAADFDGDGCLDLSATGFDFLGLYRGHCDLTFSDATAALGWPFPGLAACENSPCVTVVTTWGDYDRDGRLDLFIGNYVDTNLTDPGRGPDFHLGQLDWLFHNEGDGSFTERAKAARVMGQHTDPNGSKTLGAAWFDYDRDGWLDLYTANDGSRNELFRNLGDGTFVNVAAQAGVDSPLNGMGIAVGDYDNDGWPDLYVTNHDVQLNDFYRNRGDGTFEQRSGEDDLIHDREGIGPVGWGTEFVDIDRDGWPDIIVVNGHTDWGSSEYAGSYAQFNSVYHSLPGPDGAPPWDRTWRNVSFPSGPGMSELRVHRGAAFADYDLDGDTDLALVNNNNETAQLLRADGVTNSFLNVRVSQPGANAFGVSARVVVEAMGLEQSRWVQAGSSYLSQNSWALPFGLGGATQAERVTVEWPDGGTTTVGPVGANQTIRIDRATGAFVNDTISPWTEARLEGTAGERGWWRSPVQATLSARDRGTPWASGLVGTAFALGDAPLAPYSGQTFAFGEGSHELRFRSEDVLGNREPVRRQPVRVDLTPPEASHELAGEPAGGWWRGPVQVSLRASDAGSGVGALSYRVDGGAWERYKAPFEVAGDGAHQVDYVARDVAGNGGVMGQAVFRIDGTPPRVAITEPERGSVRIADVSVATGAGPAVIVPLVEPRVRLEAEGRDAGSGVARVSFWLDGDLAASATEAPYAWTWDTSGASPGSHEVAAVAEDAAGNRARDALAIVLVAAPAAAQAPAWALALPALAMLVVRRRAP